MNKIGILVFGPSFIIGLLVIMFKNYIASDGAYLFDYSMLEFFKNAWYMLLTIVILIAAYWMLRPFFNDALNGSNGVNKGMRLKISGKNHKEIELDHDGNIIAYRYFFLEKGELHSVSVGQISGHINPITNRRRSSYRNGYNISDRVPTLKNESGIYAAKTRNSPILKAYDDGENVLGKVRLSGRIIEGEYGYRAQYCEVLELYKRSE